MIVPRSAVVFFVFQIPDTDIKSHLPKSARGLLTIRHNSISSTSSLAEPQKVALHWLTGLHLSLHHNQLNAPDILSSAPHEF
jgi:hypothetical protein